VKINAITRNDVKCSIEYVNKLLYFFSREKLNPVTFFHPPERLTTAISLRLKCIKNSHIAAVEIHKTLSEIAAVKITATLESS